MLIIFAGKFFEEYSAHTKKATRNDPMVKWMVVMRQWWHQNDKMKYNIKHYVDGTEWREWDGTRQWAIFNIYLLFVDHASQPTFHLYMRTVKKEKNSV